MKRSVSYLIFLAVLLCVVCCTDGPGNSLRLRQSRGVIDGGETFVEITASGSWTLDVEYVGEQSGWITLFTSSGTGSTNSVIMSYSRNREWDPREAVIRCHFGNQTLTAGFTQPGMSSHKEGGAGTVLPTWQEWPGLKSDVLRGWMELPAVTETPGCAWVFHEMTITQPYYDDRNYSLFYDASLKVARWVAYPLNPGLYGNGDRTDKWKNNNDPKIPAAYQPYTEQGWGVGGYDRGHLVPSADRVRNDEANWQTFYPTNMAVQIGSGFNQRIWADLETKVRAWSGSCDTLYVVTGTVPSADRFISDRKGNRVNVPSAFYKALLKGKRTPSGMEYTDAIAFYLEHEDIQASSVTREDAMSVAALERKVGINFFVNLPDEYAAVETAFTPSDWGL